jgi:succinate-acetate transporter protein
MAMNDDVEKARPKGSPVTVFHDEAATHIAAAKGGVQGNPGPLGLLAFGITTCMLMFVNTSWSTNSFMTFVFGFAMFYGGFGQFIAGVLELIKGNSFAGTAFCSYGCFWMGFFLTEYLDNYLTPNAPFAAGATGATLWFVLWGVFTFGLFIPTLRKNLCLMTVFSTLFITFFLLAGGVHNADCQKAAGYVGFICGCSAMYAAFALLYNDELGITMPGTAAVRFI